MQILSLCRILSLFAPQGFGPRGPKPEEAYIEVPACNMISIYIGYIPDKFKFLGFLPRKALVGNIAKLGGGG